jgi:hypothetical protein
VNTILGPLMLLAVVVGQVTGGAVGAACGFAVSTTAVIPLFWWRMEKTMRKRVLETSPA